MSNFGIIIRLQCFMIWDELILLTRIYQWVYFPITFLYLLRAIELSLQCTFCYRFFHPLPLSVLCFCLHLILRFNAFIISFIYNSVNFVGVYWKRMHLAFVATTSGTLSSDCVCRWPTSPRSWRLSVALITKVSEPSRNRSAL